MSKSTESSIADDAGFFDPCLERFYYTGKCLTQIYNFEKTSFEKTNALIGIFN